jgi:outer membrane beta-barrel protein
MELERPVERPATTSSKPPASAADQSEQKTDEALTDFSGLGKLASFSEVSVIQKRYMPKTERFQFFLGPAIVTNDPFFNTSGGELKFSYFLTETWGLELNYFSLATSEKDSTKELRKINGISTVNLVYPKSYMGLDLVYVPVYGKMSWFNKKIIPFDLYFAAGYGTTGTQAGEKAGTVHLAAGQIFSITKAFALRWDFSWNFFSATGIDGSKSSANNLFLSVGASFFFPEAKYR